MSRAPLFRFKVAPPGATVAALGFIAHLTACTTLGPAFTPVHVDGPAAWPQQAITGDDGREPGFVASPIPADRWSVFHDPVLLQLQQQALGSSLDVKAAAIRLIQSRVNETTVSALRGPRLDARAAAAEQRLSESGAATRVAGALGGAFLSLYPSADSEILVYSLAVVIIGGRGSLGGAAVGSLAVAMLSTFGQVWFPELSYFVIFGPMALLLAFRPTGLFGRPT